MSAYRTVTLNKLRTSLSLLGVTIGIISIVSIFTVLDSLESNIRESLASFGNDVVVIQKWPWAPEEGNEYAWWEYMNRPLPTLREYEALRDRIPRAQGMCFIAVIGSTTIEYLNRNAEGIQVWGSSEGFGNIRSFSINRGRFFTPFELQNGRNLAIIGSTIAEELYRDLNPIGRQVKVRGWDATIIGVFDKEGDSPIGGGSVDEVIVIPIDFMAKMVDIRQENRDPQIWVRGPEGMSVPELKDILSFHLRSIRGLKLSAKDNFSVNQTSLMSTGIDQIFRMVGLAGWVIGIFAVLIGGFGIANIMFVSVKERTHIIGIQKAIGAKNQYIILEVLYESVLLSLVGGIIGLLVIFGGTFIAQAQNFEIYLGLNNIVFGILISMVIGLIAGLLPAISAARLDPVKAIATAF